MKSWEQFLTEKSDGMKPYSQLTKDYYLYMQEEDVPNLPDYGFLLSFYNYIKGGGSLEEYQQPTPEYTGFLLQEIGDYLLQENGDKIYL
jgi:hypothetical protein